MLYLLVSHSPPLYSSYSSVRLSESLYVRVFKICVFYLLPFSCGPTTRHFYFHFSMFFLFGLVVVIAVVPSNFGRLSSFIITFFCSSSVRPSSSVLLTTFSSSRLDKILFWGFIYIHTYLLPTINTYKATRQSASHPTAIILPASQSVSQPTKTTSQSIWTNTIKQQTHAPKPLPSLLLRPAILI